MSNKVIIVVLIVLFVGAFWGFLRSLKKGFEKVFKEIEEKGVDSFLKKKGK